MSKFRSRCASLTSIVALLFVSSCSTVDRLAGPEQPTAPDFDLFDGTGILGTGIGSQLLTGLLTCPALPEVTAEEEIGPDGGTLDIGPHRLVVPAGALDTLVRISGTAVSDSVVSVRFEPEGLTFARPAQLTLSYAHCPLVPSLLPKRIVYTSNVLDLLQVLLSSDDLLRHRVTADLEHFSRYAVAW